MENNKTHYSKEEIEAKIKGLLTMDLSKFKAVEEKEELFASKKYDSKTGLCLIRWESKLNISLEHCVTMFTEPEIRVKWEKLVTSLEIVDPNITPGEDVIYFLLKTPKLVKNRDFVCIRGMLTDFEGWDRVIYMYSTTHEKKPPVSGVIRGDMMVAIVCFKQVGENKVESLTFAHTDPKGIIPKLLVNKMIGKSPRQWYDSFTQGHVNLVKTGLLK